MGAVRGGPLSPAQKLRRSSQGRDRRSATRAKLLSAAYTLFARHGAEAPTIDQVIAEAAVSRGTFYNHFLTREALFGAVADDVATRINDSIFEAEAGVDEPLLNLALSFRLFVHFATVEPSRGWILLRTMPLVGPLNERMRKGVEMQFAAALTSGRLEGQLLHTIMDFGLGLQIMTIRRILVEGDAEEVIRSALRLLLTVMSVDEAEATRLADLAGRRPVIGQKTLASGRVSPESSSDDDALRGSE